MLRPCSPSPVIMPAKINNFTGDVLEEFERPDGKMHVLVHCISSDLAMGKGIARDIADRYGEKHVILWQDHAVGQAPYTQPEPTRRIYHLVTKLESKDKPTNETLLAALKTLAELCERAGYRRLMMPRIATGLDGLEWKQVRRCIIDAFSGYQKTTIIDVFSL